MFSNAGIVSSRSLSGTVTVLAYGVDLTGGSIDAGTGTVRLLPNTNEPVAVGGSERTVPFHISSAGLGNVTAGTVSIGDLANNALLYLGGSINLVGPGPAGKYNLNLLSGGDYAGAGRAIALGGKELIVTSVGSVSTGWVSAGSQASAGGGQIQFASGGPLLVDGNLIAQNGSITLLSGAGDTGSARWQDDLGEGRECDYPEHWCCRRIN